LVPWRHFPDHRLRGHYIDACSVCMHQSMNHFVKNNKRATYKSRQSAVLTGHGLQVSKSPVAGVQEIAHRIHV